MSLNSTLIFEPSRDIEQSPQMMINNSQIAITQPAMVAAQNAVPQYIIPQQYIVLDRNALGQPLQPIIIQKPKALEDDFSGVYGPQNFNFKQPRFSNMSLFHLNGIRIVIFLVNFMIFGSSLCIGSLDWQFYYLTFWSFNVSLLAQLGVCQCAIDIYPTNPKPKNNVWQKRAAILMELAVGMNAVTVILFWVVLAPLVFPTIDWHDFISAWMGVRYITLHTVPFISIYTNLYLSDITMIPSDWKMVAGFGVMYQFANYAGVIALGTPIYPIADWSSVPLTSFLYTIAGFLMGAIFYYVAMKTQKHQRK